LEEHKVDLCPLIDKRIFAFEDAPAAFDFLDSGNSTGKVVISLSGKLADCVVSLCCRQISSA